MNAIVAAWRQFTYGRKCDRIGRRCRFMGRNIQIEGHVEMGNRCHFRDHVILRTRKGGHIKLADEVGLSTFSIIEATGLVELGERSVLAEFAIVRDTTHLIRGTDVYWRSTPHIVKPVKIGKECWIGCRAYICPGVTIGDGAVVGIGSVVTQDIGPYEVWAGTPARFLYSRIKDVPPEVQAETSSLMAERGMEPYTEKDI